MLFLISCGDGSAAGDGLLKLIKLVKIIIGVIQMVVPIAIILLGSIDLAKASMAGDEKKISENQQKFIKRIIAAIIVFLVVVIVKFAMGLVGQVADEGSWLECWNAALIFKS